jgi:hypothetical protein
VDHLYSEYDTYHGIGSELLTEIYLCKCSMFREKSLTYGDTARVPNGVRAQAKRAQSAQAVAGDRLCVCAHPPLQLAELDKISVHFGAQEHG